MPRNSCLAALVLGIFLAGGNLLGQGVEMPLGQGTYAADPSQGVVVDVYASQPQDVVRVETYGTGGSTERIVSGGPQARLAGYDHRPGYVSYSSTVARYPYADYPGYGYDPLMVGNGAYGQYSNMPIGVGVIAPYRHGQAWAGYNPNFAPYFYTAPNLYPGGLAGGYPGLQGPYIYYYHRPRMPAYYHGYYYYASPVVHDGLVPAAQYLESPHQVSP